MSDMQGVGDSVEITDLQFLELHWERTCPDMGAGAPTTELLREQVWTIEDAQEIVKHQSALTTCSYRNFRLYEYTSEGGMALLPKSTWMEQ